MKLELTTYQGKIHKYLINIPIEAMQQCKTIENNSSGALRKTNPFLTDLPTKPKVSLVQELCTPFFGRISDANGEIAKVYIRKRHFRVGEPIVGILDFRETPKMSRICAKFVVSLATTETWKNQEDSDVSTVQATFQDVCYGTDLVSFTLDVPQNSTPSFSTEFCKYSLKKMKKINRNFSFSWFEMDLKNGVFYDQRYANARHPNGLESAQNCSSQKSDVANSSLHLQAIKK